MSSSLNWCLRTLLIANAPMTDRAREALALQIGESDGSEYLYPSPISDSEVTEVWKLRNRALMRA